ncbi:hypothetical protein Aca07nite_00510 [Actinoplanes capillaceus]|uniref:Uncharacterized protein n=1 Tax=Actinoplanes campanulatus TaxID=113559 RepID=A0ABQ3WA86_9ACTN|nr:hypothetical protein [Actinoplanes capillaceus]GID42776.1 hypothetical protein Aca07nite_00510 [Actinoplanes capillaceus]
MTYPPPPGEPLPPPVDPYETPQHTAPLYEQPDFGRPTYAQPGHSQPGFGQPGLPAAPPQPQPQGQSRTVAITLLSAAIALVVLVGGGIVFYLVGEKLFQNEKASPGPSEMAKADISIREPSTLNGHSKIEAQELSSLTADLAKELEGYPGAANAFGAFYGSLADKKMVAVLAAEVDIDDPQRMLDTMFQSFSGENQLTQVSAVSTGSLGGVAQCGNSVIGKEDVAICGWADEGSVGMFLHFYVTAVDVKGDFPDMRAEIETRK